MIDMGNMLRLFTNDVKHLFSNVVSTIIAIGLIVIPSVFAWYNIIACWNVFDNTGNITVAVANSDDGYKSDLIPIEVNVGEMVVSALRANDQIGWEVTSEEDAIDGAMSGKYYAAVVIPQGFSRDMLTFYSSDSDHADIVYYSNEKKNAISPKVTDTGADTISYEVNKVFAETVSEISLSFVQSLSKYADEMDVDGRIAELSNHIGRLADQVDQAASVLTMYSSLIDSAGNLIDDCIDLVGATKRSAGNIGNGNTNGDAIAESLEGDISAVSSRMTSALDSSLSALDEVEGFVNNAFSDASEGISGVSADLSSMAASVDAMKEKYGAIADNMRVVSAQFPEGSPERTALETAADRLDSVGLQMGVLVKSLSNAGNSLNQGIDKGQNAKADLNAEIQSAKQSLEDTKRNFNENLNPTLDKLIEEASLLSNNLHNSFSSLEAASAGLDRSGSSVSSSLGVASDSIGSAIAGMHESSEKMRELSQSIGEALSSGDVEKLKEVLGSSSEAMSKALSAPVGIERHAIFPSQNFGSAMAPFYTALAIYIGSLLILVVVKPRPSHRDIRRLDNPKPREMFLGRLGVMLFLSFCQTTLMALGNMFFLQVQVMHPWLLLLCFWVAGFVFTSMIYSLVYAFANLGKALAVILLIAQVTGCGGSFPLQMLPDFVQMISPYLPATHVVGAMRAAMFGVFQQDYWIQMVQLLLFLIPSALIGLVLQKPFSKFMSWYVETVESTKVIG